MIMAKKDTIKALVNRGINDETASLLVSKYSSLGAVKDAGAEELAELVGEEMAQEVMSKLAKTPSRSSPAKKAPKAEAAAEEAAEPVFEEVNKRRQNSPTEERLFGVCEKLGVQIPGTVVYQIAEKLDVAEKVGIDIDDETVERLVTRAGEMYDSHKMAQNESAGVMAAHSIGEPGTQMNLRTFHFAGDTFLSVTQGLPRLIEIVDARREPSTPSMTIPLMGLAKTDKNIASHIASNIQITTLSDVADLTTDITNMRIMVKPSPKILDEKGLNIDDIVDRLNKVKAVRGMVTKTDDYNIVIASDEPSFSKMQAMYDAIRNTKLKGIDGIKRALVKEDVDKTGQKYYTILTEGSNLGEILKVPEVEAPKVMTNSILEVADVLGIEAARNSIVYEATSTLKNAGLDVDIRHIMLVADLMTNDGTVRAIGRHGVSGKKSSVLARAAFEITAAHLLHAAMVGEIDHLEGVTENIIVGQPVTLGTGAVKLEYTPKKRDNE
ncbi:DNA-directed RNA polymerase, beta' subunit/160 kD subunit [Thermoplasmatales archaeon BRNA1]|nr:DNA-directed RNA polymerase, beta' subunit/160 kD subunit [Thermoplasmatales archaeon BRNA1]